MKPLPEITPLAVHAESEWHPQSVPEGTSANDFSGSKGKAGLSLHGDTALRRRAITELLFFASIGDVNRCQRIVRLWNLQVDDPACCDYDKRTPLHLAASEGSWSVAEWLLKNGAELNSLDRFNRTPLEEAVRGDYGDMVKLFIDKGGRVLANEQLTPLELSPLLGAVSSSPAAPFELNQEWEVDPCDLDIGERIGEGEFGIVHQAVWHGTLVAVKVLKNTSDIALGDFRAEIEVLQKVHHPNAVQFLGACTKQEPYMLITELMNGGSMADAFRMVKVMSLRRAVELALDAARGLAYMHNRKPVPIVHRDLKPANLMVAGGSMFQDKDSLVYDTGVLKLADFGLSKTLPIVRHAGYDLDSKFKLTGETGSYRFMSPEVFRHERYNSKVDVYSFAMIMYQLFEHQPPFAGKDPVDAARQAALYEHRPVLVQLKGKLEPYPTLRKLVERCWHPDPAKRPNFLEIVADLSVLLDTMPRKGRAGSAGPAAESITADVFESGASDKVAGGCCSFA